GRVCRGQERYIRVSFGRGHLYDVTRTGCRSGKPPSRFDCCNRTPTGLPAKAATAAIPIVFVTGSDPVQQGLVQHLNHPGGNLTGATTLAVEMGQKRLQLLRDLLPQAGAFGALIKTSSRCWKTCAKRRA